MIHSIFSIIHFQIFVDLSYKIVYQNVWDGAEPHCDMCWDVIIQWRAFCIHNSTYVLILALIGSDSLFCNRGTSPTCEWMIYVTICFVLIIIWLSLFVWWRLMSRPILLCACTNTNTHAHTLCTLTHALILTCTHPHTLPTQLWNNWAASRSLSQTHSPHSHPNSFKNWPNYDYK